MKDAKPIKTPMGTNGHLDLDTGGKSVDQKVYRSMIGSLLYLLASFMFLQRYLLLTWCDHSKGELPYGHRSASVGKSVFELTYGGAHV